MGARDSIIRSAPGENQQELLIADLVVVMFWNRIGSPSSSRNDVTGTVEEFQLASHGFEREGRPLVWVYFRKPTETDGEQVAGVRSFRRKPKADVNFSSVNTTLSKTGSKCSLSTSLHTGRPQAMERGTQPRAYAAGSCTPIWNFLAEGIFDYGRSLTFHIDLDGDGHEEEIVFHINFHGPLLFAKKFNITCRLPYADLIGQPFSKPVWRADTASSTPHA
jgi:hypothetical protein